MPLIESRPQLCLPSAAIQRERTLFQELRLCFALTAAGTWGGGVGGDPSLGHRPEWQEVDNGEAAGLPRSLKSAPPSDFPGWWEHHSAARLSESEAQGAEQTARHALAGGPSQHPTALSRWNVQGSLADLIGARHPPATTEGGCLVCASAVGKRRKGQAGGGVILAPSAGTENPRFLQHMSRCPKGGRVVPEFCPRDPASQ